MRRTAPLGLRVKIVSLKCFPFLSTRGAVKWREPNGRRVANPAASAQEVPRALTQGAEMTRLTNRVRGSAVKRCFYEGTLMSGLFLC